MKPNLYTSRMNRVQQRHLKKDQYKSDHADVLIATPGSVGASGEYARIWHEAGWPVNPRHYSGHEVVFVTTNGKRRGRRPAHIEEIKRAAHAGCAFLTDARGRRPEGGNRYNIGEQEVAELLRSLGYRECEEFGGQVARWTRTANSKSSLSLPKSGIQPEQETIMIKLHASFARKIPGQEQYSSDSASASVEVELPEGANIPAKLAELWDITRNAVTQQLANRGQQPVNRMPGNGNGHQGNPPPQQQPYSSNQPQANPQPQNGGNQQGGYNGNTRSNAAISEKQLKFVRSLIGELKPLGVDYPFVEALCQRLFQRGLDYLNRAQASTLIGHLSEIKAGRVTVQQLAA